MIRKNFWIRIGLTFMKKQEKLYCSSCRSFLSIDKAFSATCNHFFCSVCSTYILEKRGKDILKCPQCNHDIEDSNTEIIFLDHFGIPNSEYREIKY